MPIAGGGAIPTPQTEGDQGLAAATERIGGVGDRDRMLQELQLQTDIHVEADYS